MKSIKILIVFSALMMSSFVFGLKWQQHRHTNICLKMGGKKKSEKSSICVINKTITKPEKIFKLNKKSKKLVGSWLIKNKNWGFTLYNDKTASSINAVTLVYQKWRIKNDKLCLTAKSIGNHTQSVFEECLRYKLIEKNGKTTLITVKGNYKTTYINL